MSILDLFVRDLSLCDLLVRGYSVRGSNRTGCRVRSYFSPELTQHAIHLLLRSVSQNYHGKLQFANEQPDQHELEH